MPRGIYVRTEETRAKLSMVASNRSPETRAKLSVAGMGHPNMGPEHHTPETRAKISATLMGHPYMGPKHHSAEARSKISAWHTGSHMSPESCAKDSAAHIGRKASPETRLKLWKGGKVIASAKHRAKRRTLGFIPLNKPFPDCAGHHVDNEQVINMPKTLHCSVFHRQSDGRGMAKINAVAYNFLFKQEVETALAEVTK